MAGDLIQKGNKVRVFEALHEIGGVAVYGIPEFRLRKQIVREQIDYMRQMGVEFETDVVVGRTVTIDELLEEEGYDAVYIGIGAGLPQFMRAWNLVNPMPPAAGADAGIGVRSAIICGGDCNRHDCESHRAEHHPGLGTNKLGYIQASEETQRTTRKGVFADGDLVTGAATVILAIGAGRRAANSMHQYLTSGEW